MPCACCTRVPAAGMKPDDNAVEPEGAASRSSTTHSIPASASISAAVSPQAPAPTMATATCGASAGNCAERTTCGESSFIADHAVGRNRYSPWGLPITLPSW